MEDINWTPGLRRYYTEKSIEIINGPDALPPMVKSNFSFVAGYLHVWPLTSDLADVIDKISVASYVKGYMAWRSSLEEG